MVSREIRVENADFGIDVDIEKLGEGEYEIVGVLEKDGKILGEQEAEFSKMKGAFDE